MLRCSIHNNENYGSDMETWPDLDELLAPIFNPDISDDEVELEVEGQENANSLEFELTAIFVGCRWVRIRSQGQSQSDISSIGGGNPESQHHHLQNAD